jgi:glycosyltransferase involved in cell wall biosynthesis
VGGSHQALFDLVVGVDQASFEPIVLFYQDNVFVERLRARGIEVVLFELIRRKPGIKGPAGVISKAINFGRDVVRCRRELRRLRIDLLHLNNSPTIGNDNWLPAARLIGIPCVVTSMGNATRPDRLIHRWLSRQFDLYLAISHHVAHTLRVQGVDSSRIELIYLGVDFDALRKRVQRSRETVRRELGVGPNQILMLMVGNIREWKGQREVIAALRLLPQQIRTRLRVCFAGATAHSDAEYESELRAEVTRGGLEECVSFLGSRSDVPELLCAADIAVHASISPEPFGLVVPEAMGLGCAVIAASTGGPAEVVVPGTGLLCDPAHPEQYAAAIEQLVQDTELRRAIGAAAPGRAALFSIERNIEGTSHVYRRLLNARKPS